MNATADKLAAALRNLCDSISPDSTGLASHVEAGRRALAEHDAQAVVTFRADGKEYVGQEWDSGPQVWDVIRDDADQWLCLADPEHSALIVAALNAHAGDLRAARAALAEHDKAASDPIRAFVLRRALECYSEVMHRNARDYRAGKIARDLPGDMRERNAQGCEMRRRVADELIAELEGNA